jgi:hypothetical protein
MKKKKKKLKKINKIAFKATQDFLRSGIDIKDVFGNLEDNETDSNFTLQTSKIFS